MYRVTEALEADCLVFMVSTSITIPVSKTQREERRDGKNPRKQFCVINVGYVDNEASIII